MTWRFLIKYESMTLAEFFLLKSLYNLINPFIVIYILPWGSFPLLHYTYKYICMSLEKATTSQILPQIFLSAQRPWLSSSALLLTIQLLMKSERMCLNQVRWNRSIFTQCDQISCNKNVGRTESLKSMRLFVLDI